MEWTYDTTIDSLMPSLGYSTCCEASGYNSALLVDNSWQQCQTWTTYGSTHPQMPREAVAMQQSGHGALHYGASDSYTRRQAASPDDTNETKCHRARAAKCDEARPVCGPCQRSASVCVYPEKVPSKLALTQTRLEARFVEWRQAQDAQLALLEASVSKTQATVIRTHKALIQLMKRIDYHERRR
ncbi:hypothetical protein MRB53_042118 [Persea americana]|nr:hypothetical protein MRB53_042118 [Persea americana]